MHEAVDVAFEGEGIAGVAGIAGTVVVPVCPIDCAGVAGTVPEGVVVEFCEENNSFSFDKVFGPTMPMVSIPYFS